MPKFVVDKTSNGSRADSYIASKFPQFSRSALKGLFSSGKVLLNGAATKAGQKLRSGQQLAVDTNLLETAPVLLNLPIIYEDNDVVVVNKPAGVLTHSKGALNLEPTVASFLKSKITDKGLTGNRAGIVHRLDRATSGVLTAAKTSAGQAWLQQQFAKRKVTKTYLAVVGGKPHPEAALIDAPIGRNPAKRQSFKVMSSGKTAQTRYQINETFTKDGQQFSLLQLQPITGRTHQLRIHLAYIGHPIVGDSLYGHNDRPLLLYAKQLTITLPNGQKRKFSASLPIIFREFMA